MFSGTQSSVRTRSGGGQKIGTCSLCLQECQTDAGVSISMLIQHVIQGEIGPAAAAHPLLSARANKQPVSPLNPKLVNLRRISTSKWIDNVVLTIP